jgi:hypothetical protein
MRTGYDPEVGGKYRESTAPRYYRPASEYHFYLERERRSRHEATVAALFVLMAVVSVTLFLACGGLR